MKYCKLKPEVSAGIGENSERQRIPNQPLQVIKLHFEFEAWFGNDLMKTSPVFYVTYELMQGLKDSELTGIFGFESIEISKSENFIELYPDKILPNFFLLKIDGVARKDDFGIESGKLIVSASALNFLQSYNISEAEIEEIY